VGDSIHKKMKQVSAKEIADAVAGKANLSPAQRAAADVDGDGKVDAKDVELMAQAQMKLANKISGAIIGMEQLTDEEKAVAERNGDGFVNLTDGQRLADDARSARTATAKLKQQGK
jgi:acyl-homoserine lactone acylase PvdQ